MTMNEQEETIEIFGAKYKIILDDGSEEQCKNCALNDVCVKIKPLLFCETEKGYTDRHFIKL